jgi:hypothetical protein
VPVLTQTKRSSSPIASFTRCAASSGDSRACASFSTRTFSFQLSSHQRVHQRRSSPRGRSENSTW